MRNANETYEAQITRQIRKARKNKDDLAVIYYTQALNYSACISFERFKGSLVYKSWEQKYKK